MIQIGNFIYSSCETGDIILRGKVIQGIDGPIIEWYI
jgi:hypothetical protein